MTASYGPPALACSATCRMPAMLDRSPTTTAVAAGRAARASSALAAVRACSVTEWPSPASRLAAMSPRPSVDPVTSTRDISYSLQAKASAAWQPTAEHGQDDQLRLLAAQPSGAEPRRAGGAGE